MTDSVDAEGPPGPSLAIAGVEIAFSGIGRVLSIRALSLPGGSVVAIEGPSGAGKTSLLHALAGIERPAAGQVRWGDVTIWALNRPDRDRWRRRSVGLVFQDIHLVDGFSALDNVTLPLLFDHVRAPPALRERGRSLLTQLGVTAGDRKVTVMSRGERQRIALARALLRQPSLLLADEPTASLDRQSAAEVAKLLVEAAVATGATLIVTTHDPALLDRVPHRLRLEAGRLAPA